MVEERIHGREVRTHRGQERRAQHAVDACHELCRILRAQQLLERGAQPLVRHVVEVERRLAHLGHASTQRAAVFRVEPQVQPERALDLPLGRRRQMRGGRL